MGCADLRRLSPISKKHKSQPLLNAFHSVINLLFKRHLVRLKMVSVKRVFTPTLYKTCDDESASAGTSGRKLSEASASAL